MYTELIFGASFKKNTPQNVIDTIRYLAGDLEEEPEGYLWEEDRNVLVNGSYYFAVSDPVIKMWQDEITDQWILSARSNLKNYENEIEKFLELVKPWIDSGSGYNDMYAITMYEEDNEPKIYYLNKEELQICRRKSINVVKELRLCKIKNIIGHLLRLCSVGKR